VTRSFVAVPWRGRATRIELRWVGLRRRAAPLVVFLHEGLGSVSMWRDFPHALCLAAGCRGLVFSRPGYGRSAPRSLAPWGVDYMHEQAYGLLPALFASLGLDAEAAPPWLLGHSDGGSIALLYAARFPRHVSGAVLLAPHIRVEDLSVKSIAEARVAYEETDLRQRLARHHRDPDFVFRHWNDIWLDPAFRRWSIEAELAAITCPLLAVQGLDDEYGTLAQIRGIALALPQTELLELPACGHSPHRDQRGQVIEATCDFLRRHGAVRVPQE